MAFPDDIKIFVPAIDPSDVNHITKIKEYQNLLYNAQNQSDITAAAAYLSNWPDGIQMNFSAGRFNEVLDEVMAIEDFYLGLNGVKQYINNNITKYKDINAWQAGINYNYDNIAMYNNIWYKCILAHTSNDTNRPMSIFGGLYWRQLLKDQPAEQYPITADEPTGQSDGDLWFQIIPSYEINATVTNGTAASYNPTLFYGSGSMTLTFTANLGYSPQASSANYGVSVNGATSSVVVSGDVIKVTISSPTSNNIIVSVAFTN